MPKPVIFTITASWDDEEAVWTGHCDDIPAAADAPTLDGLLEKISAMALDLLPDNHPGVDPTSVFVQITALREAETAVAWWRRSSTGRYKNCCGIAEGI
jgi:hypothetical protein